MRTKAKSGLGAKVYTRIKNDIFDFRLLPGDRFTETEVAERLGVSRTPVREGLFQLEREGYIQVATRNGWSVKPFDFEALENLYDVRVILELAAVQKLCAADTVVLDQLVQQWMIEPGARIREPQVVCNLDEAFHAGLVQAAGNPEMARIHHDITERIRIIRRLDFTEQDRIDCTYDEHAQVLGNIVRRKADPARMLLKSHIEASKAVVRNITLHRLHTARLHAPPRRK